MDLEHMSLQFINNNYTNHGYTCIVASIYLIKIYIYLVFQLHEPLYSTTICIPTESWYILFWQNVRFSWKYVITIGYIKLEILTQNNMEMENKFQ